MRDKKTIDFNPWPSLFVGRENKGVTVPQANAGRGRGHLEMNYCILDPDRHIVVRASAFSCEARALGSMELRMIGRGGSSGDQVGGNHGKDCCIIQSHDFRPCMSLDSNGMGHLRSNNCERANLSLILMEYLY
jgi:hypothetical protein